MTAAIRISRAFLALAALAAPHALRAQDSLRVIGISPPPPMSPREPVVIAFNRPVAPLLDRSVDPATVLTVLPREGVQTYWRSPSTLVIEFTGPRAPGASFTTRLNPDMRSAEGLALARHDTGTRQFSFATLRVVSVMDGRADDHLDANESFHMLVESNAGQPWQELRSYLVPGAGCAGLTPRDTIPLLIGAVNTEPPTDTAWRRQRSPEIRYTVGLTRTRPLRGRCPVRFEVRAREGDALLYRRDIVVRAYFAVQGSRCYATQECTEGPYHLAFSSAVTAAEVRRHVRLDGAAPDVAGDSAGVTWRLTTRLRPGPHEVRVSEAMVSAAGDTLGRAWSLRFHVPHAPPSVTYANGSYVIPRRATRLVDIGYVNVDSLTVIVGRVADSARVLAVQQLEWGATGRWPAVLRDSVVLRYATPGPSDTLLSLAVPSAALPAAWNDEALLVVRAVGVARTAHPTANGAVEHVQLPRDVPRRGLEDGYLVLRRSDVAMHVLGAPGDLRVWVTSRPTARPIAGALLRVVDGLGRPVASASTDASGMATLRYPTTLAGATSRRGAARRPGPRRLMAEQLMLEARAGGDVNEQPLPARSAVDEEATDADGFDYYSYLAGRSGPESVHGAAFPERGIYRPGERVFLRGVVRLHRDSIGYTAPAGDSVRWVMQWRSERWRLEKVWTHAGRLGDFGAVVDTFAIPRTARLGEYLATLSVRHAGAWRSVSTVNFKVAEYRAPEFEVTVAADTAAPLYAGDSARVALQARYLFGVPMQGAHVRWWAETHELDPWQAPVRGLEGMATGRPWWIGSTRRPEATRAEGELETNDAGGGVFRAPTGELLRPGRMTLHATATDANRQVVTANLTLPVQSADVYVGMRTVDWWSSRAGEPIVVRGLVVGADGRRRADVPVRITALRRSYQVTTERWRADTVWSATRTSTTDTLRVAFTPATTGEYEIVMAVSDARGRTSESSVQAWVSGSERVTYRPGVQLTLAADRREYDVGDTALVQVNAPSAGLAWIILTREGVLWTEKLHIPGGRSLLRVPLPADAVPGAHLQVFLLSDRAVADTVTPYFHEAKAEVAVSRDANRLRVTVTPARTAAQPRDTVPLRVTVRDRAGRPVRGEVTLWAVDQGVASLTDLAVPEPLAMMLDARSSRYALSTTLASMLGLGVTRYSSYGRIQIRGTSSRAVPMRMDAAAAGLSEVVVTAAGTTLPVEAAALREFFSTTPLYLGAVRTDDAGEATASFALPDNLTTFRVFAIAFDAGARAGGADTAIVSSRTLAVRPSLPRVIRDGDSLLAGAVITQDRAGPAPVTLHVTGTGVAIDGPDSRTDTLDGRRARELRFTLRGVAADTAVLHFSGSTARDADAVEARLPVSPNGHPRSHVLMGTLRDTARLAFGLEGPTDLARSHLEVQAGSSPLALLQRLSETLRLYPYYCTEQLSSAGRALVARIRAERLLHAGTTLSARDRAQLETAVATMVARQREDGGFGYWSATDWSSAWLTAYALGFMDGARSLGVEPPEGVTARAREYLVRMTTGAASDTAHQYHDVLSVALALRELGTPDAALERRALAPNPAADWGSQLDVARLAAMRGDSARARAVLAEAWRDVRVEGRRLVLDERRHPSWWYFPARTRPMASLLLTTIALTPADARIEPLFDSLVETGRRTDWWWNTLDQALVGDAVSAMLRLRGTGDSTTVTVSPSGNARVPRLSTVAGATRSDTLRIPLAPFIVQAGTADSVVLRLHGSARTPVFYAATLQEQPLARPTGAVDDGFGIERWYERYDDPRPVVGVKAGELVRVRIRVTAPADREFVVIDDALPAGLEAVDLSLRTSSALPPFAGARRATPQEERYGARQETGDGMWDGGWWVPWTHREIRDDRVVYFAHHLARGTYLISYVARATTAGTFIRPPTHAEEMYNPAVHGRSDGGVFRVEP